MVTINDIDDVMLNFGFILKDDLFKKPIGDNGASIHGWVDEARLFLRFEFDDITVQKVRDVPATEKGLQQDINSFVFLIYKMGGDTYGDGKITD